MTHLATVHAKMAKKKAYGDGKIASNKTYGNKFVRFYTGADDAVEYGLGRPMADVASMLEEDNNGECPLGLFVDGITEKFVVWLADIDTVQAENSLYVTLRKTNGKIVCSHR